MQTGGSSVEAAHATARTVLRADLEDTLDHAWAPARAPRSPRPGRWPPAKPSPSWRRPAGLRAALLAWTRGLTALPSPAGGKDPVALAVTDGLTRDPFGNVVARLPGRRVRATVMLAAHPDEVSRIVRHVDDDGSLRVDSTA